MSQEKYNLIHHKDFHNLQLQNYSVKERAIFLTLCLKVMEQEDDVVTFSISELTEIANYSPRKKGDNIMLFLKDLNDKLKTLEIMQMKQDGGFKSIILFPTFEVDPTKNTIKIRVNPDYKYLLNHLQAPYTIQALIEYSELKSGYSQLMYSLLKCWNKAKKLKIDIENFRRELGVPEGYSISVIDKRVLAPIMKELPKYFPSLRVEKIKEGRSVTAFQFTWKEEKVVEEVIETEEVEVSDELLSAIEKAEKNRFIKPFLSDENIIKLLDKFSEEKLTKGLKEAYKLINKEFTSLNYLIKVIEDNFEKPRKKLILRRSIKEVEKVDSLNDIYEKYKEKISSNENIENILSDFLEEITENGYADNQEAITYYDMLSNILKEG